jgi:catechol 2,3-dioxygenase-like lactoylglutathione lyase family enzyme
MVTISGSFSGFSVNDEQAALAFYRDTLGLDAVDTGMGVELRLPGGSVFVYPKGAAHEPATFTVLNLEVADIDAAVDELVAAGLTLERYDGMEQDEKGVMRGRASGDGPDIAWFTDPSGNVVSVIVPV